jgi:hypothetical protein
VRRQDGLALVFLSAVGCASGLRARPSSTTPSRLLVHVDTIIPDKLQQFADARRNWVTALRLRGLSDRRGDYLQIGAHSFYSVEPFDRWRELERLADARRRVNAAMGAATREYDRLCDDTLAFPHASEIWSEEPTLGYSPSQRPLLDALEVVVEDVDPRADYEAAWQPIARALAQARYPIERRTFFASYGSGRYWSFWLAPSRAVIAAAPPIEQVLATQLGSERAAELMRAWRALIVRTQTLDVAVDPAMSAR